MIYGFTGHRPPRLGGYGKAAQQKLYDFAYKTVRTYLTHNEDDGQGYATNLSAIVGMAQGWDMAVAMACKNLTVPYIAAIPFPGQEEIWPDPEVRSLYTSLVESAAERVYVSNQRPAIYEVPRLLQLRNQYIVDHSDKMIALYDGDLDDTTPNPRIVSGGTFRCLVYAKIRKKEIINVWKDWEAFQ